MDDRIDIRITGEALDTGRVEAFCTRDGGGGLVIFTGKVRGQAGDKEVVCLEFEAYEGMALKEMRKIAADIVERWGALAVAIHHREGRVEPGGLAVVIGVSAPHRAEAFDGCRYAIDTLKETVPIWKKEVYSDGSTWVSAHP
jgi:molybdopterin synthase catalytic subunit